MTTISVPINNVLEEFIAKQIADHKAENKAQVIRRALHEMREREALSDVLEAQAEVRRGEALSGDIRELAKMID